MKLLIKALAAAALLAAPTFLFAQPASAGVGATSRSPTRLVLNGGRGTEVILNNIGEEPAGSPGTAGGSGIRRRGAPAAAGR